MHKFNSTRLDWQTACELSYKKKKGSIYVACGMAKTALTKMNTSLIIISLLWTKNFVNKNIFLSSKSKYYLELGNAKYLK